MNAKDPGGAERMRCPCCGLVQRKAHDPVTGVSASVCAKCTHHQGTETANRLARAETHERLLREQLEACRASESRARAAVAEARAETAEALDARTAALQSRGLLAARLVDADGRNRNHPCLLQAIAREPDVRKWARRADEDDEPHHRSSR